MRDFTSNMQGESSRGLGETVRVEDLWDNLEVDVKGG